MPMRAEVSLPATYRRAAPMERQISGLLANPDLLAVLAFVAVGLLATLALLLRLPFSDEIAAALAGLS